MECRYVAIGGAGTRGQAYEGVLRGLQDHLGTQAMERWRQNLLGVAGTSAGSIIALGLALGLSQDQRQVIIDEFGDMRNVAPCPDVGLLVNHWGIEDGKTFKEMLGAVLARGGLSAGTTLVDFKRLVRIDFVCICTDLHTGKPFALSAATQPTLRVVDAIYASCCVPFMFTPPTIDGRLVVDGSLSCDLPDVFPASQTLHVFLSYERNETPRTWSGFLMSIVNCSVAGQLKRISALMRDHPTRCISLRIPPSIPTLEFGYDVVVRHKLILIGYLAVMELLTNHPLGRFLGTIVVWKCQHADVVTSDHTAFEAPP